MHQPGVDASPIPSKRLSSVITNRFSQTQESIYSIVDLRYMATRHRLRHESSRTADFEKIILNNVVSKSHSS